LGGFAQFSRSEDWPTAKRFTFRGLAARIPECFTVERIKDHTVRSGKHNKRIGAPPYEIPCGDRDCSSSNEKRPTAAHGRDPTED